MMDLPEKTMLSLRPSIRFGNAEYSPQGKPVVLLFPQGEAFEFSTLDGGFAYLESARRAGAKGADESALFHYENGVWLRVG
jgi:hypothetical protein